MSHHTRRVRFVVRCSMALAALALLIGACVSQPPPATPTPRRVLVTLTPRPTDSPVMESDHVRGQEGAYAVATLYGDFTSPVSLDLARNLLILMEKRPNDLRVVWRHFPMSAAASLAAEAAEAASAQGKFWEMHDALLADQAAWRDLPEADLPARMRQYAAKIGLPDLARFETDLAGDVYALSIASQKTEAEQRGILSAPALVFQNRPYNGRVDSFGLENALNLILLDERHFAAQPAMQIDLDKHYTARLITQHGDAEIELFVRAAPVTVNNFVFLARAGWYDDITFHLVTPELAQTGDPSGSGFGTAGYTIFDESDNGLIFDREGMVAMARERGVPNSASAQFFVTFGPLPPEGFNGQYTIFGQVTSGMDVLRRLTARNPFDALRFPSPLPGDRLLRVEIVETNGN